MSLYTVEEAKSLLHIDLDNLEEECANQSFLFVSVGEAVIHAFSQRDEAKDFKEIRKSQIALSFRVDAENSGEKLTENKLEQKVLASAEYEQIAEKLREAVNLAKEWDLVLEAFRQRVPMIGKAIDLYTHNYWQSDLGKKTTPQKKLVQLRRNKNKDEGRKLSE